MGTVLREGGGVGKRKCRIGRAHNGPPCPGAEAPPTPNPSRKREGRAEPPPFRPPACGRAARLGEAKPNLVAAGWVIPACAAYPAPPKPPPMPEWTPRNTTRARSLRNAATPAERLVWRHIARSQLGAKFSRQMPVGPYYADFLCREARLVVELDGFSHELRPQHDAARDRWLRDNGYTVLRFTNAEVKDNIGGVIAAIKTALNPKP